MTAILHVKKLLHEGAITGRHSGKLLREAVLEADDRSTAIIVDFQGMDLITQSAADEFIGRIIRQHISIMRKISFSNCPSQIAEMLEWSAAHANSVFEVDQAV
jgi:hypothetical protein